MPPSLKDQHCTDNSQARRLAPSRLQASTPIQPLTPALTGSPSVTCCHHSLPQAPDNSLLPDHYANSTYSATTYLPSSDHHSSSLRPLCSDPSHLSSSGFPSASSHPTTASLPLTTVAAAATKNKAKLTPTTVFFLARTNLSTSRTTEQQ